MPSPNNNPDNKLAKQQALFKAKEERFLFLCYAVFQQHPEGVELMAMLKESFLEQVPVADPAKEASHAYFREGQNAMVRALANNAKAYEIKAKENNQG